MLRSCVGNTIDCNADIAIVVGAKALVGIASAWSPAPLIFKSAKSRALITVAWLRNASNSE